MEAITTEVEQGRVEVRGLEGAGGRGPLLTLSCVKWGKDLAEASSLGSLCLGDPHPFRRLSSPFRDSLQCAPTVLDYVFIMFLHFYNVFIMYFSS